jgi:hypothetical protein
MLAIQDSAQSMVLTRTGTYAVNDDPQTRAWEAGTVVSGAYSRTASSTVRIWL